MPVRRLGKVLGIVGIVLLGVAMVVLGRALGAAVFGAAPLDLREDEAL